MRGEERRCGHRREDGSRCRTAFGLCDCHGECWNHAPCREEERRAAVRKGAAKTNRRHSGGVLDPEDLPPLRGPRDAEAWLAALAEGVVSGRVSKGLAGEARKLLKAWLSADHAGEVSEKLERLDAAIRESRRRGGDVTPILELVEGERDA